MYFVKFAISLIYSIIQLFTVRSATQKDIIQFIINTNLALTLTSLDGSTYCIQYQDCTFRLGERPFKSVKVIFTMEKVKLFLLNGAPVDDLEIMFSTLIIFLVGVVHPKCHLMSERSVHEIKKNKVQELERSTWSTMEIDYALLNSSVSPIVSNLYLMKNEPRLMIQDAFVLEGMHEFLKCKNLPESQFFKFLLKARTALKKSLIRRRLEVDPELLFNNMIVHSVDHYMCFKYSEGIQFNLGENKTMLSYIRSFMFRHMFIHETLNPFDTNLISSIQEPFYKELYNELTKYDSELASHITASLMY